MSESSLRDAQPPRPRDRCPYCHEELGTSEKEESAWDARVACAACGAPHHAECIVENEGCAATGCRVREVRVAGEEAPILLGVLAERCERGELAEPSQGKQASGGTLIATSMVALALIFMAIASGRDPVARVILLAVLASIALFAALAQAFASLVQRRGIRIDPTASGVEPPRPAAPGFDVAFSGQRDPWDDVRERIESEAPEGEAPAAPAPPASLPARCPSCANALEPDPDGEPIAFCYHCGAPLA